MESLALPAACTKTQFKDRGQTGHLAITEPNLVPRLIGISSPDKEFKYFACTYKDIISILQLILVAKNGFYDLHF